MRKKMLALFLAVCLIVGMLPLAASAEGETGAYTVLVFDPSVGKVEADRTSANAGDTITLTLTPGVGYKLGVPLVEDADKNMVEITKILDTETMLQYTFVMPASDVTVTTTCDPIYEFPFTDVTPADWYYPYVERVIYYNAMNGISDTIFDPSSSLSRAMAVQILYNMAGKPAVGKSSFTDIEGWYKAAITWAEEKNIASGYGDGRFGPNDNVTREQLAMMIYKYATLEMGADGSERVDLNQFSDANQVSSWALTAMQWANATEIISGNDNGTLAPSKTVTRAEAATMIVKYINYQYY